MSRVRKGLKQTPEHIAARANVLEGPNANFRRPEIRAKGAVAKRKLKDQELVTALKMYADDIPLPTIAKHFGLSATCIRLTLLRNGITPPTMVEAALRRQNISLTPVPEYGALTTQRRNSDQHFDTICRLKNDGLTYGEIGDRIGINRLTVSLILRRVAAMKEDHNVQ